MTENTERTLPRGLRNNNPGNIRRSQISIWRGQVVPGTDRQFCQFRTMAWGYRALMRLLRNYQRIYGLVSVRQLIGRYAPASENDTDAYVRFVAGRMGVGPDQPVDLDDPDMLKAMASAVSRMENGVEPDPAEVEEGYELHVKYN